MPHDAGNASGSDGAAIGASPKPIAFFAVGKIETADGPFTIVRSDSAGFPGRVGDVVFRGDIVETAIGTEALIVFVDGTTFRLYSGTQLVLDQFTHGPDPSSNATALRVGKGKFGFIAGTVARTGRFVVNTPLSTIRSVAPAGGMGAAAFLFVLCVIRQVEAQIDVPSFSEELSFADPEDLTPNDLWHGVYDVLIEGVVHSVHDPEEALVARHRGAGVVVERVKHSSQQMSDLQLEFGKAAAYFKLAQLDPFVLRAGNERAGSSTFASTFDLQQLAGLSKPYFPVVYSPPPAPVQLQIPMGGQVGSGSHVTYAAHFELLPISNDQQPGTIIFLGPRILPRDQGVPPNSVAIVSLSIPQGETLLSVQIYDLPVGDTIICNGISYAGGGPGSKITISAGNFYATGLYLEGHASATTDIYLTATVLGLGGALESPKDAGALTLSVDLSGAVTWTGEANPPDQDWNNPDNWSTKAVPIPFQDVRLHSLGSSYVINVTDADVAIDSLVVEAGVTLNIKNGRTFSLTTESIKPLANAGIVTVDSALLIIGIPAPALEGIVTNAGTLQIVNDGTVEFINVAVANGGTISMATATSTLELNATTIDGGTIINHGLLKASVGTSVLSNLASGHFSNDGTIEIIGGATLVLDTDTLDNSTGTVQVDDGATLTLSATTVHGGTINDGAVGGTGTIHIVGNSTIDQVDLNNGFVNVDDAITLTLQDVTILGTTIVAGASTIIANGTTGILIDAFALAENATLSFVGTSAFMGFNLVGNLDAHLLSGALTVTTADAGDNAITITTGSGATTVNGSSASGPGHDTVTVNAGALAATLTLTGTDLFIVNKTGGSLTVDASGLAAGTALTLDGTAGYTVSGLACDLVDSGSGTLNVTTADNLADNTISVTTGSGATTVNGSSASGPGHDTVTVDAGALAATLTLTGTDLFIVDKTGGSLSIDASGLAAGTTLTLNGTAGYTVSGLVCDLVDSGSGTLNVTTADNLADNTISVTTGSGAAAVNGSSASGPGHDTVTVHAALLADDTLLTLSGTSKLVVDGLQGNLTATGVSGALSVTIVDVASGLSIATGSGSNIIDATALADTHLLTLTGTADVAVSLSTGDLTASSYTGNVIVTGGNGTNVITTGSGDDILNGGAGADTLDGGGGSDTADYSDGSAVRADLSNAATNTGDASGDSYVSIENLRGSSFADVLLGDVGNNILTGGLGADTITGGDGADTFVVNSGESLGVVSGSGDAGTITGYDVIDDFTAIQDILDLHGAPVAAADIAGTDGADSLLTIGGQTVKSHAISNGVITFDESNSYSTALTLTSTADVAAVVQYLQNNDLGNAGVVVAFTATVNSIDHTYVYEQVGDTPNGASDILIDLSGVTVSNLSTLISSGHLMPAGVAGSPINLGLADLATDRLGALTVTVGGVPSGWSLSEGTDNGDGTWTIQTGDPESLAISAAADFAGANLLTVIMTAINADGSSRVATFTDNVEAFALGSPIFAWSGDDTLTGSAGHDEFVFVRPIGHDAVYNFDATADQINLIGFGNIASFADIQARTANNADGNAVIALGDGQSITLIGVDAALLTASDFTLNREPVTYNAGIMTVGNGAVLPLAGVVENHGTIAINSADARTVLEILDLGVTLQGGGYVALSGNRGNVIFGATADATLTNIDNTISGSGQLGNGQMTLVNEAAGVIAGDSESGTLVLDTGSTAVANYGTIEAISGGTLEISSSVDNFGMLCAGAGSTLLINDRVVNSGTIETGGTLYIFGPLTGEGLIQIDSGGILELGSSSSADVHFTNASGTTGSLWLDDARHFSGDILNFAGDGTFSNSDIIDLKDINFFDVAADKTSYLNTGDSGILTLRDVNGAIVVSLAFVGSYELANFAIEDDLHGGTFIVDPPLWAPMIEQSDRMAEAPRDTILPSAAPPAIIDDHLPPGPNVGVSNGFAGQATLPYVEQPRSDHADFAFKPEINALVPSSYLSTEASETLELQQLLEACVDQHGCTAVGLEIPLELAVQIAAPHLPGQFSAFENLL